MAWRRQIDCNTQLLSYSIVNLSTKNHQRLKSWFFSFTHNHCNPRWDDAKHESQIQSTCNASADGENSAVEPLRERQVQVHTLVKLNWIIPVDFTWWWLSARAPLARMVHSATLVSFDFVVFPTLQLLISSCIPIKEDILSYNQSAKNIILLGIFSCWETLWRK